MYSQVAIFNLISAKSFIQQNIPMPYQFIILKLVININKSALTKSRVTAGIKIHIIIHEFFYLLHSLFLNRE